MSDARMNSIEERLRAIESALGLHVEKSEKGTMEKKSKKG